MPVEDNQIKKTEVFQIHKESVGRGGESRNQKIGSCSMQWLQCDNYHTYFANFRHLMIKNKKMISSNTNKTYR